MESEKKSLEKEAPLGKHHFQVGRGENKKCLKPPPRNPLVNSRPHLGRWTAPGNCGDRKVVGHAAGAAIGADGEAAI